MNGATLQSLAGWTPIRVMLNGGYPLVDWCRLPAEPFTDPFFEQTIGRALRQPARLLFRQTSLLDTLAEFDRGRPGLAPAGFIFHMSRCGSTLLAQLLAALPGSIVVSEAPPIDQLLQLCRRAPGVAHERRLGWLRGMVNAFGQRRRGDETRYFIKFDCWHTLELPFILEAFPGVPWVFLYRDPVEVLVSHQRRCGSQMIPGVLDPRMFELDPGAVPMMAFEEYGARILAGICRAALAARTSLRGGRLMNFDELPATGWEHALTFFGQQPTEAERTRLREVAGRNAKNPSERHVDDRSGKQREATSELRRLADEWLGAIYAELEATRASSASSVARSQSLTTQSITR